MGNVRILPVKANENVDQMLASVKQQASILREEGNEVQCVCVLIYTPKEGGETNYRGGWSEDAKREHVHYVGGWLMGRAQGWEDP